MFIFSTELSASRSIPASLWSPAYESLTHAQHEQMEILTSRNRSTCPVLAVKSFEHGKDRQELFTKFARGEFRRNGEVIGQHHSRNLLAVDGLRDNGNPSAAALGHSRPTNCSTSVCVSPIATAGGSAALKALASKCTTAAVSEDWNTRHLIPVIIEKSKKFDLHPCESVADLTSPTTPARSPESKAPRPLPSLSQASPDPLRRAYATAQAHP